MKPLIVLLLFSISLFAADPGCTVSGHPGTPAECVALKALHPSGACQDVNEKTVECIPGTLYPNNPELDAAKAQIAFLKQKLALTEQRCESMANFYQLDGAIKQLQEPKAEIKPKP